MSGYGVILGVMELSKSRFLWLVVEANLEVNVVVEVEFGEAMVRYPLRLVLHHFSLL